MTATAKGLQVPGFPQVNPKQTPVDHDKDATLTADDMFKIHVNTSEDGPNVLTLPKAADVPGCAIRIAVTFAGTITVTPAAGEKIWLHGSGTGDGTLVIPATVGHYVDLYSDGAAWLVARQSGVLTKGA